jgi:hypothetical protein
VIGLILFGQNHLYVKMRFNRDSAIHKSFRRFCKLEKSILCQSFGRRVIPSGRSYVHCSISPEDVPSVRKTCHTVRTPDRPSIIRLNDVDFRPDPPLYREASVPACIHSDVLAARPDASQYSTKFQVLSKFIYGKIAATVRTMWIPVRTRFSLRQESQFKFNRPDVCQHGPNARSTYMKIADSTSTV